MTEAAPYRHSPGNGRRESILAAAIDLFCERGYDGVGMRDLAAACDVSATAIYRHFSSKEALLIALYERVATQLANAMRTASEAGSGTSLLSDLIRRHVRLVLENPRWIAIYEREMSVLPMPERKRYRKVQQKYLDMWTDALLIVRPDIQVSVAQTTVIAAFGAINSVGFFESPLSVGALEQVLVDVAMRAVGHPLSGDVALTAEVQRRPECP